MKVVNEKFEVLEEGVQGLDDVSKTYPEKRIFVEVKGNATVILPDDCVILVLGSDGYKEIKKPRKERKKKEKGEKESDEEATGEGVGGEALEHALLEGSPLLMELTPTTSKTPKKERQPRGGKEAADRRRSLHYNLKEILTKKGTNRFRPMSDRTVEEILEKTLTHRAEVKEWTEYEQVLRIVENLTYLVDKHRRTLTDNTALKPQEPISNHHIQLISNIELLIDEHWKTVEHLPRPEPFPQEAEAEADTSLSTLDPTKPEGGKKRKREEEADFETLAKKVAAIREKNLSEHKYEDQGEKAEGQGEEHEVHHDLMDEDQPEAEQGHHEQHDEHAHQDQDQEQEQEQEQEQQQEQEQEQEQVHQEQEQEQEQQEAEPEQDQGQGQGQEQLPEGEQHQEKAAGENLLQVQLEEGKENEARNLDFGNMENQTAQIMRGLQNYSGNFYPQ